MSTEVGREELVRPLKVLAPLIKEQLKSGDAAGVEHYRRAGEMLLEAKGQLSHGEWSGWVKRNFRLSKRTASDYMKLAEAQKGRRLPFSSIAQAVGQDRARPPGRPWQPPDLKALIREQESMLQEKIQLRELSLTLIDVGYRTLAKKLHPDKGGSKEGMQRLNEVRRLLKNAV